MFVPVRVKAAVACQRSEEDYVVCSGSDSVMEWSSAIVYVEMLVVIRCDPSN